MGLSPQLVSPFSSRRRKWVFIPKVGTGKKWRGSFEIEYDWEFIVLKKSSFFRSEPLARNWCTESALAFREAYTLSSFIEKVRWRMNRSSSACRRTNNDDEVERGFSGHRSKGTFFLYLIGVYTGVWSSVLWEESKDVYRRTDAMEST